MQRQFDQYKARYNLQVRDPRIYKANSEISDAQLEQKFCRNNETLNYEFDTNANVSNQIVEYQIQDQNKSIKDTALVDKYNKLKEQEEQIDIEEDILDFIENERYFSDYVQRFCLRCNFVGHRFYECNRQLSIICTICLSKPINEFIQVFCGECYEKGHKKNVQAKMRPKGGCDRCLKQTHRTQDCGMLLFENTNEIELVKCLKCLQYGHINCQK